MLPTSLLRLEKLQINLSKTFPFFYFPQNIFLNNFPFNNHASNPKIKKNKTIKPKIAETTGVDINPKILKIATIIGINIIAIDINKIIANTGIKKNPLLFIIHS